MQAQPLETLINALLMQDTGDLSPLGAGIIAAAAQDISHDSRTFAKKLGLAHALVIRECVTLSEEFGFLQIEDRADRSQRLFYVLSEKGQALMQRVQPA